MNELREIVDFINHNNNSRAAAVVTSCEMIVANNPDRIIHSKAASIPAAGVNVNKAKVIHDFVTSNGSIIIDNDNPERKSKAASVPGVNKLREIVDFMNHRY